MDVQTAATLLGWHPQTVNVFCVEGRLDSTVNDDGTFDVSVNDVTRILLNRKSGILTPDQEARVVELINDPTTPVLSLTELESRYGGNDV